jgi:hypothetical protein
LDAIKAWCDTHNLRRYEDRGGPHGLNLVAARFRAPSAES